jgi:hypothetical protein
MLTNDQLEANQRDIIAVLQWLIPATTKAQQDDHPSAFAMRRLLAQIPKPANAVDTRPDGVRRKEFIKKMSQPASPEQANAFIEQQKPVKAVT